MDLQFDFSGQVALVTGATRGIGQAIARDLQAAGADLILTGTNPDQIAALNHAAAEARIKNVRYIHADFDQESSLQAFLDEIGRCEKIDICINNAGIGKNNPIYKVNPEDYERLVRVDLRAPFLISRSVCQLMQKNGYGRIVNIGSIWGVISREGRSVYSVTKAGLIGMTRSIAIDMARYNVLANAVSPGFVMTDLTTTMMTAPEIELQAAQVPLSRFARPEEISHVVLFLASNLNTYLTGQNIIVDGGFTSV